MLKSRFVFLEFHECRRVSRRDDAYAGMSVIKSIPDQLSRLAQYQRFGSSAIRNFPEVVVRSRRVREYDEDVGSFSGS